MTASALRLGGYRAARGLSDGETVRNADNWAFFAADCAGALDGRGSGRWRSARPDMRRATRVGA